MTRKPPMTATEAADVVSQMRRYTKPDAAARLMRTALGPLGNLSDEAREVYRAELARMSLKPKGE